MKSTTEERCVAFAGNMLRPGVNSAGYSFVVLYKDGLKKLLCSPPCRDRICAQSERISGSNHINEDKLDNRAENLEWCEKSYNINYGTRNQRVANVFARAVTQCSLYGKFIATFQSLIEAEKASGVAKSNISKCCRVERRKAGGFTWKYEENSE